MKILGESVRGRSLLSLGSIDAAGRLLSSTVQKHNTFEN